MAVAAVMIPFSVYLITLAPSVTFFDSGEFITAINSLGSAHSPGYPLFVNYAKPFTYIPLANVAFRVNIATAFSAAMACYGVYLLLLKLLESYELSDDLALSNSFKRTIALGSALTFAFSARLWLQSNHDKPYPLVAFLSAVIFYFILCWRDSCRNSDERPSYLYLAAYTFGLSFAAHQTMILLLPSCIFLIISVNKRLPSRVKEFALAFSFGVIGFSIHLHLPIRATQSPQLNWGDPQTLTQFLWHFLRKGYPVVKPRRDLSLFRMQLDAFNIPHEFTWAGMILVALGLCVLMRRRRDEVVAYLIGVIVFLAVIVGYLNTSAEMIFLTEEFFTPLYLLSAVFMGVGIFYLLKVSLKEMAVEKQRTVMVRAAVMVIAFVLPVTVFATNYRENDQHENYIPYDYAVNTICQLPELSILFTWGDSGAFPLWYLQGEEKMRPDISVVHTPHLYFKWYLDTFPELFAQSSIRNQDKGVKPMESLLETAIMEQYEKRPVFIDFSTRYSANLSAIPFRQEGICYRMEPSSDRTTLMPDLMAWDLYFLRGIYSRTFFRDIDTEKAIQIYAYSRLEGGETLMRVGAREEAARQLMIALRLAPEFKPQIVEALSSNNPK
jgi:hypothetical protein